ncbi:flagellar basal body P-ring formation chaperone FlgA [Flocculibacter collagenilyticus]|uniref:flagellar basal body P-ring formation chaperone FlgA n=1 Tax=Flocculibacter collagenilyticus TaxID=2744479 RepID=UPI0018F7A87E|nr:flagellar basal body P-ring formation chaperone FlgA [Flocculibacter collagenilyticus]
MNFIKNTLLIIALLSVLKVTAATPESLAINDASDAKLTRVSLQQMAENYVKELISPSDEQLISFTAVPLDTRIEPKQCNAPVELSVPANSSFRRYAMVSVKCADIPGWSLYIQVKIQRLINVVVASMNIPKGKVITKSDVKLIAKEKTYVRNKFVDNPVALIGSKAKRFISQHQIIDLGALCFVCKGDAVTILAKSSSLAVKTSGVALQDGSLGALIRVKNTSSNKQIKATVTSVGKVQVNF